MNINIHIRDKNNSIVDIPASVITLTNTDDIKISYDIENIK